MLRCRMTASVTSTASSVVQKVRRVTADGWDYFECGECGRRAGRRIMLDPEMETELSYPARYVTEMHRGELEDR
jgi:hypothetical protein